MTIKQLGPVQRRGSVADVEAKSEMQRRTRNVRRASTQSYQSNLLVIQGIPIGRPSARIVTEELKRYRRFPRTQQRSCLSNGNESDLLDNLLSGVANCEIYKIFREPGWLAVRVIKRWPRVRVFLGEHALLGRQVTIDRDNFD